MKKGLKRILLLTISIIVLAILIIAGINFYPMITMTPSLTGQVLDTNILAVKNGIGAVYLIKTENGFIAIDAGTDLKKLAASLQEANINPADVHSLLLTHSDFDHVAGLTLFPQVQIFMSEAELPLINGTVKRTPFSGNSLPAEIDSNKIKLLQDKENLSIDGINILCIKSSGHTIGSMSFLIDDAYFFTGDAFKVSNGTISVHPFTMNEESAKSTIEQLKVISKDCSIILTAHYGFYEEIK